MKNEAFSKFNAKALNPDEAGFADAVIAKNLVRAAAVIVVPTFAVISGALRLVTLNRFNGMTPSKWAQAAFVTGRVGEDAQNNARAAAIAKYGDPTAANGYKGAAGGGSYALGEQIRYQWHQTTAKKTGPEARAEGNRLIADMKRKQDLRAAGGASGHWKKAVAFVPVT